MAPSSWLQRKKSQRIERILSPVVTSLQSLIDLRDLGFFFFFFLLSIILYSTYSPLQPSKRSNDISNKQCHSHSGALHMVLCIQELPHLANLVIPYTLSKQSISEKPCLVLPYSKGPGILTKTMEAGAMSLQETCPEDSVLSSASTRWFTTVPSSICRGSSAFSPL